MGVEEHGKSFMTILNTLIGATYADIKLIILAIEIEAFPE